MREGGSEEEIASRALEAGRRLFDEDYYWVENPELQRGGLDPFLHYLKRGAFELRNPNPLFDSHWYLSTHLGGGLKQNPLLHYVTEGAPRGLDPHPLFDTACYCLQEGEPPPGRTALEQFLSSSKASTAGAYRSLEALLEVQKAFYARGDSEILQDLRGESRRWAVFLQCGGQSLHPEWLKSQERPWDLLVNFYDDSHDQPLMADFKMRQRPGTKFSAIHALLEVFPEILARYDALLLLDDDIRVSEEALTRLFEVFESLSLDLAQPALKRGSFGAWEILFEQPQSMGRYLTAVEIMMPLLSRRALSLGRPLFGQSVSGWGLDFVLGEWVGRYFGPRAVGVIDGIAFGHERPIDRLGGSYYRMLLENGLSPLVEERALGLLYGARGPIDCAFAQSGG